MKFVWDEKKNLQNIRKHKVSFVQAVYAFLDPMRKEYYDERHSTYEEERLLLFGFAINAVLIVSFTEPDAQTVRIISARKAKKRELEAVNYGNGKLYS